MKKTSELSKIQPRTGTPKRWVISKDARRCPSVGTMSSGDVCVGWQAATARVEITNPVTGAIKKTCRKCGAVGEDRLYAFKLRMPCSRCKDFRDVTVHVVDGDSGVRFADKCEACKTEISAIKHAREAARLRTRAAEMRARNKARQEEGAQET